MATREEIEPAGAGSPGPEAGIRGTRPGPSILQPGRNVWRVARARRAVIVQDAAAYYGALRRTMLNARRSIHILGWDIDSRTPLIGTVIKLDGGHVSR